MTAQGAGPASGQVAGRRGRQVSRSAIVTTIVRKDFKEFSRDQLYIFLSALGLVFFALLYYLVPDTVDESITLGVHQRGMDELVEQFEAGAGAEQGLELVQFPTTDALATAVEGDSDVTIGIAFPDQFVQQAAAGERPTVTVYADAAVPPELRDATLSLVREIAYAISGQELPVAEPETVILGPDRVGDQASLRDALLPMLIFFVLMIETFAISSLIANEVLNRTVTAVLATPARVSDFLTAKTVYGTLLTGGQALILLFILRAITFQNAAVLLAVVALGGVMFTGIAMISGSAGRDFFGTLFYNMLFILPLIVPTFAVLFPGTSAAWVQIMPSYPIIDAINQVTTYGAGWADVVGSLGIGLAWVVVIYISGLLVLRRKVRTL